MNLSFRKFAQKQPWQMTKAELQGFEVPSVGDRSASPGTIARMREEMGTLLDYAGDDWMIKDWLGAHTLELGWDVSYLAEAVKRNEPIIVYRATDTEDAIFPGAYVTPSKQYAIDHGERHISAEHLWDAKPYKLLELEVRPDELIAMNQLEFHYAPGDIFVWHEAQIRQALERGEDVPNEVLADYHHLTEGSVRLNLRKQSDDIKYEPYYEILFKPGPKGWEGPAADALEIFKEAYEDKEELLEIRYIAEGATITTENESLYKDMIRRLAHIVHGLYRIDGASISVGEFYRAVQENYFEKHPFRKLWQLDKWATWIHEQLQTRKTEEITEDDLYLELLDRFVDHHQLVDAIFGRFREMYGSLYYGYIPEVDTDAIEPEEED